jgi:basic amino acid/polyamine antiporter, APA family
VRRLPGEGASVATTEPASAAAAPVRPLRHLGFVRLTTFGINSVIGGGIFILPATVAALLGAASLPAYVAAALLVLGIGTVLGRLAARFETSGGMYAYIEQAFGPLAGFLAGWLFWFARTTSMGNLMNGAALYLGALWPVLASPLPRAAVILIAAALVTGLDIAGIRQASRASSLFTFLKVAPLLVVGVAGLALVEPARLMPHAAAPASFLRAVLLLMYAFTGFESMVVPAEESKDPRRDMPRALFATIVCVCAIYLTVHVAALGALPDLGSEQAPLASLAAMEFGQAGRLAITFAAALSMAGCALSSLLGGTRMVYAMSSVGRIPVWFGALHPKSRTPVRAALLTGAIATWLAITGAYAFLAAISSGSRLLIFAACCAACLVPGLRKGAPAEGGKAPAGQAAQGTSLGLGPVIPALTGAAILLLLTRLEPREVLFGMIGIGAGVILSLLAGRGRRIQAREGGS